MTQHIEDRLELRKASALGEPAYTALLAVARAARRLEEEMHLTIEETDLAVVAGDSLFRALGDMRDARISLDKVEV